MAGKPCIPNVSWMIQAGINPKTGLPVKFDNCNHSLLKDNIRKNIRIIDEQDAINTFEWFNLPEGLDSKLIERILYYRGQAMFFYMKQTNKFYFLPYTLYAPENSIGIDVYGRFTGVTPVPFNGTTVNDKKKEVPWIAGLRRFPKYEIVLPEELKLEDLEDSCVLIKDYTEQISQTNIARQILNEPIVDLESDMLPFLRTSLLNSTGIAGIRTDGDDATASVEIASQQVNEAALDGKKWIGISGSLEMQELTGGEIADAQQFLMSMQSIDNFRLATHGLENGGLFEKQAHELQTEANMAGGRAGRTLQDRLEYRQKCANIINSIWGLGVWVEPKECAAGDLNMDGNVLDSKDQSGAGNELPEGAANE